MPVSNITPILVSQQDIINNMQADEWGVLCSKYLCCAIFIAACGPYPLVPSQAPLHSDSSFALRNFDLDQERFVASHAHGSGESLETVFEDIP